MVKLSGHYQPLNMHYIVEDVLPKQKHRANNPNQSSEWLGK
jgi:hypothetical protein